MAIKLGSTFKDLKMKTKEYLERAEILKKTIGILFLFKNKIQSILII